MFNIDYYREERNKKMKIGSLFGAKHVSNVHGVKDDDAAQKQEKSKFPPDWFANAVAAQGGGFQQ